MTDDRQTLGRRGEAAAQRYIERRGVRVLTMNYTCAAGEIDLIGETPETLIFFEVKTRRSAAFGPPHLAVHHQKQRQIVRAAQWYLAEGRIADVACRFDVIAVSFVGDDEVPHIEWLKDAFPAEGVRLWG